MRIEVRFQGDVAILSLDGRFLAGGDGPYLRQKVRHSRDRNSPRLPGSARLSFCESTGASSVAGRRLGLLRRRQLDAHPAPQRLARQVRLPQAEGVHQGQEVGDVGGDLVVAVEWLVREPVAPDEAAAVRWLKGHKSSVAAAADPPSAMPSNEKL